jgi:GTP-binding protein
VLFVNNPAFLDDGYRRFMLNRMRELLPYAEVPIRLIVRGRQKPSLNNSLGDRSGAADVEEPGPC